MRFRPAALAAAVFVATAGLGAAPTPAAAAERVDWAPVESATIYPGVGTESDGAGCTANFVFTDRAGGVYIGQAAHCTSIDGSPLSGSGCDQQSKPLGSPVTLLGSNVTGTLAYSSWQTMQKVGETDEATCQYNDFALLKIPASAVATVNPSVPVFGGPVGLNTSGLPAGEPVFGFGASNLRGGIETPQQGFSLGTEPGGWYHLLYFLPPGVPGDSGGGVVDGQGRASGVLISLNTLPPGSNGLTDVAHALAYAQEHSGIKGLQLVPGTEPFVG